MNERNIFRDTLNPIFGCGNSTEFALALLSTLLKFQAWKAVSLAKCWNYYLKSPIHEWKKQPFRAALGKNVFWEYAANLNENTHTEVWIGMSVLL